MKRTKNISVLHAFQTTKLDPNRFDQRSDLENNAKYHQSCRISLAFESLKGLANDLLQIHLMISIVHLQKVDGALLKQNIKCELLHAMAMNLGRRVKN